MGVSRQESWSGVPLPSPSVNIVIRDLLLVEPEDAEAPLDRESLATAEPRMDNIFIEKKTLACKWTCEVQTCVVQE